MGGGRWAVGGERWVVGGERWAVHGVWMRDTWVGIYCGGLSTMSTGFCLACGRSTAHRWLAHLLAPLFQPTSFPPILPLRLRGRDPMVLFDGAHSDVGCQQEGVRHHVPKRAARLIRVTPSDPRYCSAVVALLWPCCGPAVAKLLRSTSPSLPPPAQAPCRTGPGGTSQMGGRGSRWRPTPKRVVESGCTSTNTRLEESSGAWSPALPLVNGVCGAVVGPTPNYCREWRLTQHGAAFFP